MGRSRENKNAISSLSRTGVGNSVVNPWLCFSGLSRSRLEFFKTGSARPEDLQHWLGR